MKFAAQNCKQSKQTKLRFPRYLCSTSPLRTYDAQNGMQTTQQAILAVHVSFWKFRYHSRSKAVFAPISVPHTENQISLRPPANTNIYSSAACCQNTAMCPGAARRKGLRQPHASRNFRAKFTTQAQTTSQSSQHRRPSPLSIQKYQ